MGSPRSGAGGWRSLDARAQLDLLRTASLVVERAPDLHTAIDATLRAVAERLGAQRVALAVPDGPDLVERASWAPSGSRTTSCPELLQQVADQRRVIVDTCHLPWIGVPVQAANAFHGVLEIVGARLHPAAGLVETLAEVGIHLGRSFERDALAQARLALEDSQTAFIARAAHDLRGPLATLGVSATTLLARYERLSPAERDDLAATLEQSLGRVRQLIAWLVDVDDLANGRRRPNALPVTLAAATRAAVAALDAPPPVITIDADEEAVALADPAVVGEILTILLLDAARRGGPSVRVTVSSDAQVASVSVIHAGHSTPGFGLDLTLAHRLARAVGGDLVDDRDGLEGAGYVLTLPTAAAAAA